MDRESKRTMRNGCLPAWEAYHKTLCDAQTARGQFLLKGLFATIKSLKNRICYQAREWNIRLCPHAARLGTAATPDDPVYPGICATLRSRNTGY